MKTILSITKRTLIVSISLFLCINSFSQNNNPVLNYDYFVTCLKEHYGLFPYKNIKWDSLSTYYSRFVTDKTSSDSLFFTICKLASNLRDKHLWIDNEKYAYNYSLGKVMLSKQVDSVFASRQTDKDLVKSKYLNNKYYAFKINNFLFGKIGSHIGYLSIDRFDGDVHKVDSAVTNIIKALSDCNYLIIDIRNNIGGTDSSALTVANHFVKTGKCYQISKIRKGNKENTYSDPVYWNTSVQNVSFNKPVAVLINRYSISAAETFSLALKGQEHIKFLGEPSAGAFSDSEDAYLPNSWHFTYSIGVWTDCNGILWEEKGIPPDIELVNNGQSFSKVDEYIEHAIKVFRKEIR